MKIDTRYRVTIILGDNVFSLGEFPDEKEAKTFCDYIKSCDKTAKVEYFRVESKLYNNAEEAINSLKLNSILSNLKDL